MTDTKNAQQPKVEIVYTDEHGAVRVLACNCLLSKSSQDLEATWDLRSGRIAAEVPWPIQRGLGYMLLKTACTKLPLDPDFQAGVAAVAAYQAAQRATPTVVNNSPRPQDIRPPLESEAERLKRLVDCDDFKYAYGPSHPALPKSRQQNTAWGVSTVVEFGVVLAHPLLDNTPSRLLGVLGQLIGLPAKATNGRLCDDRNIEITLPTDVYDILNTLPVTSAGSDCVLDYLLKCHPGIRVKVHPTQSWVYYRDPENRKSTQALYSIEVRGVL